MRVKGIYGDFLATGQWASLAMDPEEPGSPKDKILTWDPALVIPVPESESVLFLRITLRGKGGFKVIAKGHATGHAWLWRQSVYDSLAAAGLAAADAARAQGVVLPKAAEGPSDWARQAWSDLGVAWGNQPVCFDNVGEPVIATPADGTQGIRYVDELNRPVTGDDTYNDERRVAKENGITGLWEYTVLGGVAFGQGATGLDVVFLDDPLRQHRRMLSGNTRFVHADWDSGDHFGVSTTLLGTDTCEILAYDRAGLRGLPLVTAPPVDIPPVIIVPPGGPTMQVPNRAEEIQAFWRIFNGAQRITDLEEKHRFTTQLVSWLNATETDPAIKGRFGRKSREGSPGLVSKDTLGFWLGSPIPQVNMDGRIDAVDIISSSGDVGWDTRAEQGDPGYRNIRAMWLPVPPAIVDPGGDQDPKPDAALDARLKAIEARLAGLDAVLAEGANVNEQQWAAIHALENRPPGTVDLSGYAKKGDPVTVGVKYIGTSHGHIDQ